MSDNFENIFTLAKSHSPGFGSLILLGGMLCLFSPISAIANTSEVASQADEVELGRRIYLEGTLPSGAPLIGTRFGNTEVAGTSAACVNCHRRSGMGSVEGDIQVPPITGKFLFSSIKDKQLATMDPRVSKFFNQAHDPYNEPSLAEAIIQGTNNRGQNMNVAMPRYILSDLEMQALTAYLQQLSSQWSPGVSGDNVRFATVITPDVDPVRRKALIDMVRTIVHQKNGSTETATHGHSRHHMTSAAEFVLGTERTWDLDVWELQGTQDSWGKQLEEHYRSHPVFALVSGMSDSSWQPVHDFCERAQVPCWFPSLDLPSRTPSKYSFYFTGGVTLEAEVLARYLLNQKGTSLHLVQIHHDDEVGRAASQALTQALSGSSIAVENRILPTDLAISDALRQILGKLGKKDAVMFWLRPEDIKGLAKIKPVAAKSYFSAVLAKAEHAPLPTSWKGRSRLVYPYEMPDKRELNLQYFHAWLNLSKQPLVDEAMQSEVFFAFNFLTDTMAEMLDNMYRDYLLERAETMINKREGTKAEQETRDRLYLGRPGDLIRKHGAMTTEESVRIPIVGDQSGTSHGTSIYPHLSLGPGQRFASKGGYIVRFVEGKGDKLVAETDWIIP